MAVSRERRAFRIVLPCFSMSHSFTILEGTATCTTPPSRAAISVFLNHVRKLASDVSSSIWTSAFCQSSRLSVYVVVMRVRVWTLYADRSYTKALGGAPLV